MAFTLTLHSKDGKLPPFEKLESEARKYGVHFTRSGNNGTFSGRGVKGAWEYREDWFELTITDKPFILGESMIKAAVEKWFLSVQG